MLRSIGWISLLLIAGIRTQAQEQIGQPKVELAAKSPEIQKMQQFIDIPVSFFTGSADIKIPVHTMTSKGNTIPITLDYHTGGIKAEESSNFVGLGWMLTCGGMITRTVRGNRDEGIFYQTNPDRVLEGTHYVLRWPSITDSLAAIVGWYGGSYVDGGTAWDFPSLHSTFVTHNAAISSGNIPPQQDEINSAFNGLTDGQPDLFYINCGNYSGKFILSPTQGPIFLPYNQDLKITPVIQTADLTEIYPLDTITYRTHYFATFKVSSPDGKDYYFGENGATVNLPNIDGPQCIGGWLLTRVIDRATLDTVTFTYAGVAGGASAVKSTTKFVTADDIALGCVNAGNTLTETQSYTAGRPSKITSSKEVLDFYYSGNGLDSIKVSDRSTNTPYKKLQFDYRRLISNRQALAGYTVKDLKTSEYLPYSFNYYDTAGFGGIWSQDYWGYHNGANNGHNLFVGYPGCYAGGANRNPAWPAMKQDVLTEVIYPTGGKTILEYEPHMAFKGRKPDDNSIASSDAYYVGAYNNFSLPATIGGLRVKRMLIYDPLTKDTIIRKFSYLLPDGNSSGFLYIPPKMVSDVSFSCPASTPGVQYYLSTHPMYMGNSSGQAVTYTKVQMQEEKNGVINGHTEYDYYDDTNTDSALYSNALSDTTNNPLTSPYAVMPDFMYGVLPENYISGKEKEKRVYNANGDLLTREISTYRSKVYGSNVQSAILNAVSRDNLCGQQSYTGFVSGSGQVSGTYSARRIRTPSHKVFSFSGPGVIPRLAPPQSFYFVFPYTIRKIAVQLYQKITENHPSPLAYTTDTTTYTYGNANHVNSTMTATRNSKSEVTQQQTLYSLDFNDVNSGDSTFYFMRMAGMNVPIATFKYKNGNIVGGGYRQYKLQPGPDKTVFLTSNEYSLNVQSPGIVPAALNVGSVLPQAFNFPAVNFVNAANYKYNTDNTIGYVTKKGNEKVVVLWDYNKNFVVAQASNCDSADIAFTGFETNYNGNWNVAGSARVSGSSVTGKQSYSLSSGNVTRSGLNAAKTYIVSYWSLTAAATVNSAAATAGNVKRGWHYYEHKLPAATTSVTISGSVTIDELRLYPSDAQMNTYAFDPMVGMTASVTPNSAVTYYEYDGVGKLRFIRDADNNITKAAKYFYTVYGKDSAIWRSAGGNTRYKPCPANASFNTNIFQKQQIDINPNSSTFGVLQWSAGDTCKTCDITAWQDTGAVVRCVKDANNNNTGYQEKEQKDMNPCSATYSQIRWVSIGINTTACPIPPPPCTGADKRMINGVCVTGQRVNTGSGWNASMGKFACTYHYEWLPDCIKGSDITEYNTTACSLGNACVPD
jgi:hypothetical protein